MSTNPYEPPQSIPATLVRSRRWKWRIILPLAAFTLLTTIDVIAVKNGFSLRTRIDESTAFDLVVYLNFPGILATLFFGDLLHHPNDIAMEHRNILLFCGGGILSWTLLAFVIGLIADIANRK